MRAAVQLLLITAVSCQYRGGSISWERLGDSNTVRFTVKTSWTRTGATFVQVVDGVATAGDPNFQPKTGDVINVLGVETPKFITSNGFESYLQVTVTSHTERQGGGDHRVSDWTYWTTNFFEGISTFDVDFASADHTYTAELQGCCRMDMMRAGDSSCVDYFSGQGILKMCNTPYHLRASLRLDQNPPPLSFLPAWVPFRFSVLNNTEHVLQLPVIDFMDSMKVAPSQLPVRDPDQDGWDAKITREAADAFGSLSQTASVLAPADEAHRGTGIGGLGLGRRLLDNHEEVVDLEPLPPQPSPGKVMATASVSGTSVRMLKNEHQVLKLYSTDDCTGSDMVELLPGMDLCNGTMLFPSGNPVIQNLSCVLLPPRLSLQMTDTCSVSSPPSPESTVPYLMGQPVHFTDAGGSMIARCNNFRGSVPRACRVNQNGVVFPRMLWTTKEPEESCSLAACATSGTYTANTLPNVSTAISFLYRGDNHDQPVMYISNALPSGNYPVTLMLRTSSSASTMIEFVLHVMDNTYTTKFDYEQSPERTIRPMPVPTGFQTRIEWSFVGDVPPSTLMYNNINADMFGSDRPSFQRTDQAPQATVTWSPCLGNVGLYFICSSAVAVTDRYIWAPLACVLVRVLEDLPPRITMFEHGKPGEDQDTFSLYMGQSFEAVVQAFDNPSDSIDFLQVSKIDANTGDRLRARISYVYANVGTPSSPERALMPRLVEPGIPPFLSLVIGGPQNATETAMTPHMYDRVISYTPTRMHSGLEFSLCFLAVDARGVCPKDKEGKDRIGSGMERCMHVSVQRCKYALSPGQELSHIAGLFETNWLQFYAHNPLIPDPEVPFAGVNHLIINIGHLYKVERGENLYEIVRSMGMSHNQLRFLNADLSRQKESWWTTSLPEGQMVCVIPNSCAANV